MKRLQDLPIRTKLVTLILLCSSVALIVATTLILVFDSYRYIQEKKGDLRTQAEILGRTSTAALSFNDAKAATEYLAALKAKTMISAAALYQEDGSLFARYSKNESKNGAMAQFPPVEQTGNRVEHGELILFRRIEENAELIGTVYLRADLQQFERALNYAEIVLLVMLASLGAGWWLSIQLQSLISAPILEIANIAKSVIDTKDYGLRARKHSEDEIGLLADAFNQMLAHIAERDATLLTVNQSLQQEIAAHRQSQAALQQNMQELARSNAELEQFAYVSSHDLQEPLRMVSSYTQLLEQRYADKFDEKGLIFLHYIVDGARRMQQLIDDLLMFSRVGTRGKDLQSVPSLESLKTALLNLRPAIQESGAEISYGALPMVLGDAPQLTQLFQNLVSNALKFRGTHSPQVKISASRQNEYWLFVVEDNGIGIEKEYFERIFVIFQRLHGRSEFPGSGIGLAICKKIVDRHGGRIWVESEPGHGSRFYFTLREAT